MNVLTRHTPGLAPGTLISDPNAAPTTVRVLEYSLESVDVRKLSIEDRLPELREGRVLWLDVVGLRDIDWIQKIGTHYTLHPLLLEDVVNVNQRPKAESYGNLESFLVARVARQAGAPGSPTTEQISLSVRPGLLVSFREAPGFGFDLLEHRLHEGRGRLRRSGADYLAYAILDTLVDSFQPILTGLGNALEQTEVNVLENPADDDLKYLHRLRRRLIRLRRTVLPLREAIATVLREADGESLFRPETAVYLRDCYDHVTRTLEQIDNDRELASSLADLYLSTVSNRTNDVMKVLTMIATVFIPLSFLVGLYGMNFDTTQPGNMPELALPFAYPTLLGTMAAVVVGFVVFFKRRGWL